MERTVNLMLNLKMQKILKCWLFEFACLDIKEQSKFRTLLSAASLKVKISGCYFKFWFTEKLIIKF